MQQTRAGFCQVELQLLLSLLLCWFYMLMLSICPYCRNTELFFVIINSSRMH
jgi:hypothetical protein